MTPIPILTQRVQRFRYGAYAWLALQLWVLAGAATQPLPLWCVALSLPLLPWLLGRAERALDAPLQPIENVVTPLLIGVLAVPLLPAAAVVGALLTGTVAQLGWRVLPRSIGQVALGWAGGALFAMPIGYGEQPLADVLCVAFIVLYTTPLCALGYEETMRMHRLRERFKAGSSQLAQQRDRLARYVAAPVAARSTTDTGKAPLIRRWLTVAFIDIVEFTALTERLAPEDVTTLLDEFFAGLVDLAEQHGGNLHKFLGDGALISFGDAVSHGRHEDARACVVMLAGLAALIAGLNTAAQRRGIEATLAVRGGVASGFCSVGDFGCGARLEYTLIGAPVNLASRLENLAAAGQIWAAETTRNLVGADRFDELGCVAVKGVSTQLPAYRLRVMQPVDAAHGAI